MHSSTSQDGFISLSRSRNSNLTKTLTIALVAIAVFWLDQFTKSWLTSHLYFDGRCLPLCGHKVLVPGWLQIALEPNYHGAFGLFGNNAVLLIGMALVVLVVFWYSFRDIAARSILVRVAFGMIAGGAIGNIVDRIQHGYVIDFIDFYRFPNIWRFTFNVADACITIGVALLFLSSFAVRHRS